MVTEDVLAAAMQTLQRQYDGEIDAIRGAVAQAQAGIKQVQSTIDAYVDAHHEVHQHLEARILALETTNVNDQ